VGQFEINHAAAPTRCWNEPSTPEIRPGDTVEVSVPGDPVDTVVVSDIELTEGPTAVGTTAFTVKGRIAGSPPISELDVEVRLLGVEGLPSGGRWRSAATDTQNTIEYDAPGSENFTATFLASDNEGPVTPSVIAAAQDPARLIVLAGQHITQVTDDGIAAATEALLVDPADRPLQPEDPACPATAGQALTAISSELINLSNNGANLTVSGVTTDSTSVDILLSDNDPATTAPVNATPAVLQGDAPFKTWSAVVPAVELGKLNGTITLTARHLGGAADPVENTRQITKDILAPGAPTVSPNGGAISGLTPVSINPAAAGDTLRFTVGNGSQLAPTATSGIPFTGQFNVSPGQTVKAIAVDGAGNPSSVTTAAFTQASTPPVVTPPGGGSAAIIPLAPGIREAKSGKPGGVDTATAKWRAPRANGAVVERYKVRALKLRPGRSAKIVDAVSAGANAKKLKMSLAAGKYKFQVRAISDAGRSPWSARSNQVRSR